MAVAGNRRGTRAGRYFDDVTAESLNEDPSEGDEHLNELVARQYRAAQRLDRVATIVTAFAWVLLAFLFVAGVGLAAHYVVNGDGWQGVVVIIGASIIAPLSFAGAYLPAAWARAFAAKSKVEAQQAWMRGS